MKKMLWGLAASALVLSSCSNNEVFDEPNNGLKDPNQINFMTSTTKANSNTKEQLKGGFTVYANQSGKTASNAWYLGPQTYKFTTAWGWDTGSAQTEWPTAGTGNYPLDFYAFYPKTATGMAVPTASVAGGVATLTAAITVQTPTVTGGLVTTNQTDYLAAKASTVAKPGNGYLALNFQHIMSKINAAIIPGFNTNVHVQAVKFQKPRTNGTFNYVGQSWDITAAATRGVMTYMDKAIPGSPYTGDASGKVMTFTGSNVAEDATAAQPIYNAGHGNNLMLVPQILNPWVIGVTKPDVPAVDGSEAYIEVIYRVTDKDGKDLIGYTDASKAPGWTTKPSAGRPLFIKVGFPLTANWEKGKGYTYNIKLGTADATGGNYLEDTYYDENGEDTGIKITDGGGGTVNPGDPVSKGTIGFTVTVSDWTETTPSPIIK